MKKLIEEEQKAKAEWLEYHRKHSEEQLTVEEIVKIGYMKLEKRHNKKRGEFFGYYVETVKEGLKEQFIHQVKFDYKKFYNNFMDKYLKSIDWEKGCKIIFDYIKYGIKRKLETEDFNVVIPELVNVEKYNMSAYLLENTIKKNEHYFLNAIFFDFMNKHSRGEEFSNREKIVFESISKTLGKDMDFIDMLIA